MAWIDVYLLWASGWLDPNSNPNPKPNPNPKKWNPDQTWSRSTLHLGIHIHIRSWHFVDVTISTNAPQPRHPINSISVIITHLYWRKLGFLEARHEKNVNEMTMYKATHSLLDLFEIYWLFPGYLVHTRCIIGYGRVFLLHVNIRIIILSCIYLGHSDATVLISNIQLETNNGSKQQGNIYRLDISRCSLKGI